MSVARDPPPAGRRVHRIRPALGTHPHRTGSHRMTDTAELEDRITELEEERDALADEVKSLKEDVSDLTSERDALNEKVEDAQRLADEIVRELNS